MGSEKRLVTSKGVIIYSVYDFIRQISKRPVIWDKEHLNRRNRFLAWHDVIRCFVPYFNQLSPNEQNELYLEFAKLWKLCTNTLMRSIKLRQSKVSNPPRLYRYTRNMEFYLNMKSIKLDQVGTTEEFAEIDEIERKSSEQLACKETMKGKRKITKINADINDLSVSTKEDYDKNAFNAAVFCDNSSNDDVYIQQMDNEDMNHDYAYDVDNKFEDADQDFFDSIKPFLNKLCEKDILDFKIKFLEVLKKYQLQNV